MSDLNIRNAQQDDAAVIHEMICELAEYERLRDSVVASAADIAQALFESSPRVFCAVAEWRGEFAGIALWFYNYSTFLGRHGIYLEDLFVRPAFRGHGIGRKLIVYLAQRCVAEGLARFQWSVLDWNTPAIGFYESLGANLSPEWVGCRLEGDSIARLAQSG